MSGAVNTTRGSQDARIQAVIEQMRTFARVAGLASVEELNPTLAQADARFADYAGRWADELSAALLAEGERQDCPLLADDEYQSNPFVASCGAKFDTYEEMAHHERKHRSPEQTEEQR
jgi:hypothetical protein